MSMHNAVFYAFADFYNQVNDINKQLLKQSFADAAFVYNKLSEYPLVKVLAAQGFPIIHVSRREHKANNLVFIIENQVQLKPKEPNDGALPFGCNALENPI